MNFLHNLKYAFISLMRNKTNIIWTLIFPVGLATFMFAAFGNLFESDEMFKTIPVAVVRETDNAGFQMLIDALSKEGEDVLLSVRSEDEPEALQLLEDKEICAIIYVSKTPHLLIQEEGIRTTIIQSVLEEYQKNESIIVDAAQKNLFSAIKTIAALIQSRQTVSYTEISSAHGTQDEFYTYFYAVFAMSCLFASFVGVEKIRNLQANESALGMRRSLSSTAKSCVVISEFAALTVVQFLIELIVLGYFTLLGINFGNRYPAIMLVLFFGSSIGISMGMIIGSFARIPNGIREGLCVIISMILSVLADLCIGGIKNAIENTVPIINRLNPAALISDSLYALNVYENYDRYFRNLITLAIMSAVMVIISFMILRRNKYASL